MFPTQPISLSLIEKSQRFRVPPVFLGKSAAPFCGGYIAGFVPMRLFDPVDEFTQACSRIFSSTALQERSWHDRLGPRPTNDGIKQRRVSTKAVPINRRARVHVGPTSEQPLENLALTKVDRQ